MPKRKCRASNRMGNSVRTVRTCDGVHLREWSAARHGPRAPPRCHLPPSQRRAPPPPALGADSGPPEATAQALQRHSWLVSQGDRQPRSYTCPRDDHTSCIIWRMRIAYRCCAWATFCPTICSTLKISMPEQSKYSSSGDPGCAQMQRTCFLSTSTPGEAHQGAV